MPKVGEASLWRSGLSVWVATSPGLQPTGTLNGTTCCKNSGTVEADSSAAPFPSRCTPMRRSVNGATVGARLIRTRTSMPASPKFSAISLPRRWSYLPNSRSRAKEQAPICGEPTRNPDVQPVRLAYAMPKEAGDADWLDTNQLDRPRRTDTMHLDCNFEQEDVDLLKHVCLTEKANLKLNWFIDSRSSHSQSDCYIPKFSILNVVQSFETIASSCLLITIQHGCVSCLPKICCPSFAQSIHHWFFLRSLYRNKNNLVWRKRYQN